MATRDQGLGRMTAMSAGGTAGASRDPARGTDELKSLLAHLTDQILEADRRHSKVINHMQDRLTTMGQETRNVRAQVPGQNASSLENAELGLQQVAGRIADPISERRPVGASSAAFGPAGRHHAVSVPRGGAGEEASAPPRNADVERTAPAAASTSASTRSSDPWDPETAEALSRVYEALEPAAVRRTPDPERTAERPTARPVAAPRAVATPAAVREPVLDQSWLDDRLAKLSEKVEQSLEAARPDGVIKAFGERFDDFEERLGQALEGLASRSDVEGLKLVEAHITELAQHFEAAQSHLGRLDGIETQLQSVIGQLSDERLAMLIAPAATPAEQPDLERLARTAADLAATRVHDLSPPAAKDGSGDALKGLIERFIDERRRGDEQTASMLDAMQQALLQVLDRMDAMERSGHGVTAPTAASAIPAPVQDYASIPQADASHTQPEYDEEPTRPEDEAAQPIEAAYDAGEEEPQSADEPEAVPGARPAVPSQDLLHYSDAGDEPSADGLAPPAKETRNTVDRIRQELIADAHRAKQKAAAEAAGAAKGGKPAARKASAAPSTLSPAPNTSFFGSKTRRLIVAALIAVVAINGALLLMPRKSRAPVAPPPAKSEPAKPDAKAAAPAAAPTKAQAPQPGASGAAAMPKAAPGQKKPVAPAPETAVDEFGFDTETPDEGPSSQNMLQESDEGQVVLPQDMQLQSPLSAPLTAELIRLDGGDSGSLAGSQTPAPIPAAVAPEQAVNAPAAGSEAKAHLDLPPATVGPLSLRLAAANGDASAEFEVGARLAEGKGTAQNFGEALRWYQRSAMRGFAQAQYRLGTLFERGLGAKADPGRARVWYQRAAEQGNVKAMHNLAVLSAGSATGSPDYPTAARWFAAAAERDLADSQFNYAVLCESGLGVAKDLRQAYKWFALSARSGDAEAVRRREQVKALLSPADLAAAEELVKTYERAPVDPLINDARAAGEDWKKRQSSDGSSS